MLMSKSLAPINDINLLKKSPNICYLNGDTSLLQSNEVTSIINGINKFLTIAQDRWWVKEYCFEEGYPIAFYTVQTSVLQISTARVLMEMISSMWISEMLI